MENLLHHVNCGQLTNIVGFNAPWKAFDHRVIHQQTFYVVWNLSITVWSVNIHSVWCGKLSTLCDPSTDILCGVENLLNCVWCRKLSTLCDPLTEILCDVENFRSSCFSMYCRKLLIIVCNIKMINTCLSNPTRK